VLADPRLGIAELVEPLHQLEVALHAEQRVLVVGMERRQKHPRAKRAKLGHAAPPELEPGRYYRIKRREPNFSVSRKNRARALAGPCMLGIRRPDRHALPHITLLNVPTVSCASLPRERVRSPTQPV